MQENGFSPANNTKFVVCIFLRLNPNTKVFERSLRFTCVYFNVICQRGALSKFSVAYGALEWLLALGNGKKNMVKLSDNYRF